MDSINKIDYHVRDLSTRSVTLFPTRAQIRRNINNISLQPGTNQVTVIGLSPTVDKDSVKIEGGDAVTISDVSVEALPNRDIFEDIYPDSSDTDDSSDDQPDLAFERRWKENDELRRAKLRLASLEDDRRLADETVASAQSRLKLLDDFGKALDRKRGVVIEDSLETYKQQRAKAYEDYMAGLKQQRLIAADIEDQADEVGVLQELDDKARLKADREKESIRKAQNKEFAKKARRREERRKEKERLCRERAKFWPRFGHVVRITLETAALTPSSSRRSSVSSETRVGNRFLAADDAPKSEAAAAAPLLCDLVLSYVTSSAHWVPSYDLLLSTTDATGTLNFDAELHNTTSETWSNCKVILSTSQAIFSGLDDAIPTLSPWYLSLVHSAPPFGYGQSHEKIAQSADEVARKSTLSAAHKQNEQHKSRSHMFGLQDASWPMPAFDVGHAAPKKASFGFGNTNAASLFGAAAPAAAGGGAAPPPPPETAGFGALASATPVVRQGFGGLFATAPAPSSTAFAAPAAPPTGFGSDQTFSEKEKEEARGDDDQDKEAEFAESTMEENGLTSTYELPGLKTLVPKSTPTKQRVTRIQFTNTAYSHTVVAKRKPVAYLKAKMKNTSKITLFKGRAGLTLDGSFMGRTWLPRCSAGETFTLSLGVDPAIKVMYPQPVVQRATSGLFSKENTATFTRSVTLHNTRASNGEATALVVLDQIPVSQDEKLRVEVVQPQGMSVDGGDVKAGAPGMEAKDHKDWGFATASLKKNGEVKWNVRLNPGKAVRLTLEYGVAFPNGTYPR